jgi:glutathione S-transferase
LRLYDYAPSGNCYKPRLLLALLGRDYERVPVDIFAGETLSEAYAAVNPAREVPVLELDDGSRLRQSGAILWYLAEGTPWLPDDTADRARVLQWLFFEQERVMSGIGAARFRLLTQRAPELAKQRQALGRSALEMLEAQLGDRDFLLGEQATIADVANFAYTSRAGDAGLPLDGYPAVAAWLDRIRGLPGFMDDFAPYPANAHAGASRSIYD